MDPEPYACSLPEALERIMSERSWNQCDLASELGVTQPAVSRYLRGMRELTIGAMAVLLERVGLRVELRIYRKGDIVNRREFHSKIGAVAGGAIAEKAAGVVLVPSSKTSPYQDPEYIRSLAARLSRATEELGGVPLVSTALRHVRQVEGVINSRDLELQKAASDLTRKASLALYDAKQFDSAEETGMLALTLARRADYFEGAVNCFENMCFFTESRNPLRAAHFAQQGLLIPELTEEFRARLKARFGTAIAKSKMAGRSRTQTSRSAIDEARSIDGLSTITTAVVLGSAGVSLARLGRYEEADNAFSGAIQMFSDKPQLCANWMARRIEAALSASKPTRAADQMYALARVAPLVASARLDGKIVEIMAQSAPWEGVSQVREARDQLRAIMPPSLPKRRDPGSVLK